MRYGGGQNLLASESTAKDLSDSSVKATNLQDLTANHNSNSKDSIVNLRKDSIDSTANCSKNPKDSSVNYGTLDSADSTTNHNSDSIQNINKNIFLAQNDSTNPSATNKNSTNPNANPNQNTTDSSDSNTESKADSTRIPLAHAYDLGRIERTVATSPDSNTTISIVTSEDIANNGAQNVAEALRLTPGVFYGAPNGSKAGSDISIRGYGGDRVGIFIDGIPTHSIYDRYTDYGIFDTYGLSEISISKGYASPQYGMNTLGGAVNIITSKPLDRLEASVRYGFISNNEHQVGVSVGSNLGTFYTQASYGYTHRDTFPLSYKYTPQNYQTNLEKRNSYLKNHTLRFKIGFEPNENHEYSLNLIYTNRKAGGMGSDTTANNQLWTWGRYNTLTLYLLGRSQVTDAFSVNTRLFYRWFDNFLENWRQIDDSAYDDHSVGGILTFQYDFTEYNNLKFGVNIQNDNHIEDKLRFANSTGTPYNYKYGDTLRDISTSIFVEYAHKFSDMFRLMLSGSYDRNDMIYGRAKSLAPNGRPATSYTGVTTSNYAKAHLQGGTAQAIVFGDWNENITSWLTFGYKDALPSLRNRYSAGSGFLTPNNNLQPESAINVEVGTKLDYQTMLGTSKAEVAVFYNDLTNMFVVATDPTNSCPNGTDCSKYENAREGYSYGVEVGFTQGFWEDRITLGANYTYTQKNTTGKADSIKANRILNYPEHIANVLLGIYPHSKVDILANLTYQSPQWSRSTTTGAYTKSNEIFLMDLKANVRVIDGLQVSLGAYNVFDYNYYLNAGEYMPGRRFFVSLEYKY